MWQMPGHKFVIILPGICKILNAIGYTLVRRIKHIQYSMAVKVAGGHYAWNILLLHPAKPLPMYGFIHNHGFVINDHAAKIEINYRFSVLSPRKIRKRLRASLIHRLPG